MRRTLLLLAVLALSIGCDQSTKWIATSMLEGHPSHSYFHDVLRIVYVTNPGAFLSFGGAMPDTLRFIVFTAGVGLGLLAIMIWVWRSRTLSSLEAAAIALVLSGGISNWIDRLRFSGRVVDFLNLGIGSVRTGIFNVADVAIVAGAALLFVASRRKAARSRAA